MYAIQISAGKTMVEITRSSVTLWFHQGEMEIHDNLTLDGLVAYLQTNAITLISMGDRTAQRNVYRSGRGLLTEASAAVKLIAEVIEGKANGEALKSYLSSL